MQPYDAAVSMGQATICFHSSKIKLPMLQHASGIPAYSSLASQAAYLTILSYRHRNYCVDGETWYPYLFVRWWKTSKHWAEDPASRDWMGGRATTLKVISPRCLLQTLSSCRPVQFLPICAAVKTPCSWRGHQQNLQRFHRESQFCSNLTIRLLFNRKKSRMTIRPSRSCPKANANWWGLQRAERPHPNHPLRPATLWDPGTVRSQGVALHPETTVHNNEQY